jgi:DNA-binding SARP family transcriptional activator
MLDIKLFGTTRATTSAGQVTGSELGGAKPRQILAILALAHGPVSKDHLADVLWEGEPPPSYLGTLESYVCLLRRSLGEARGRRSVIGTVLHGYQLDKKAVRVDLTEFRTLLRAAQTARTSTDALEAVEKGLALVSGELLASEAYATWALRERETFRVELVSAASVGAAHALAMGDHDTTVRLARTAIGQDPLAEEAWRLLMRALCAAGRRSEALRAFFDLRGRLMAELGADPSAETADLYLEMLRSDPTTTSADGSRDAHDEARMLVDLLRQAVSAMPRHHRSHVNPALDQVAARLALAS